jgi:hypothetical protein
VNTIVAESSSTRCREGNVSEATWTQVKNMLGMTNLLLLVVVGLLIWQAFHTPKTIGRFQPFPEGTRFALDTKTGKLCATIAVRPVTDENTKVEIPVCSDLE